jgi:hypothetical protein
MNTSQKQQRERSNRLSMQYNKKPIQYNKVSATSVLRTMPYQMIKEYVADLEKHIQNYGESNDRTLQLLDKAKDVLANWEK